MRHHAIALGWLAICLCHGFALAALADEQLERRYEAAKSGDVAALAEITAEAEAGRAAAQLMAGNVHQLRKDHERALAWYLKAAEQGVAEAQFNLGQMYRKGLGTTAKPSVAAKWYRKAADQGNTGAMYNLAGMYLEGQGVPQSEAEARKLLQRAADLGHATARRVLSQLD